MRNLRPAISISALLLLAACGNIQPWVKPCYEARSIGRSHHGVGPGRDIGGLLGSHPRKP